MRARIEADLRRQLASVLRISCLPTYALTFDPTLVLIDTSLRVSLPLWMCHHRELADSARVGKVLDWLRQTFDARRKPWFRKEFVHPSEFLGLAREQAATVWGSRFEAPAPTPFRIRS